MIKLDDDVLASWQDAKSAPLIRTNKQWSRKMLDFYKSRIYDVCYITFGITSKTLKSKNKPADYILCRKTLCNALILEYGVHPTIMANFILKDRTTVLYYLRMHEGHYEFHSDYKEAYDAMLTNLKMFLKNDEILNLCDQEEKENFELDSIRYTLTKLKQENQDLKQSINSLKKIIN
tara:strand:+ start:472 stop:1002 length:531 start_codon:yes stop_codon:yes gene_type:complete